MAFGKQRDLMVIHVGESGHVFKSHLKGLPVNLPLKQVKEMVHVDASQKAGTRVLRSANDYGLLDWSLNEIPEHNVVSQVPEPGMFFIAKIDPSNKDQNFIDLVSVKVRIEEDQQIKDYLSGISSRFTPDPITLHDIFLAYSTDDQAAAEELVGLIEDADLTCFVARMDLAAGELWSDALREGLRASRMGLLLLTPNSFRQPWVMSEAGALWVLGRPIVAAWRHIDIYKLPEIITDHEVRQIETYMQLTDLIAEIRISLRKDLAA
jgi:hypothetical protein